MTEEHERKESEHLPVAATEFIDRLIKKMRYRRKVRDEVRTELTAHFDDELRDLADDVQKDTRAQELIAEFGDPKLLAVLMRRAKKRCRPLWRKVLVRTSQAFGIFILYLLVCSIPLFVGEPTLRVNYVDWLNQLVQAGRDEADNARPYYEKACELRVEMPKWLADNMSSWPTDFNDTDSKLLSDWLQENQKAIEKFRQGANRPAFWGKYHADAASLDTDLMIDAMESLADYRKLAYTMRWQIRQEVCGDNVEAALNDCIALIKFGGHLQGQGLQIEQLIGIAIEAMGHSEILKILERFDVPADILKSGQQQLEKHFDRQRPVISLEAEKVFWYDGIQRGFTDDGQGGGRLLARGLPYVLTGSLLDNLWTVVTFDLPDREEMIRRIDDYFAGFADALAKTPWEVRNEPTGPLATTTQPGMAPILLEIVAPAYARVNAQTWWLKTSREALLTILAVTRFEQTKGSLPGDLDELIRMGYLKKLPNDAFSDKSLIYRRSGDSYILYSVGPDFKDDGGVSGAGMNGMAKQWADTGDTIFWPLPARR